MTTGTLPERLEVASRILAGFCANPSVFAANGVSGWSLVNCTDGDLIGYALHLADGLIGAAELPQAARRLVEGK